jgi:hypothetical protein
VLQGRSTAPLSWPQPGMGSRTGTWGGDGAGLHSAAGANLIVAKALARGCPQAHLQVGGGDKSFLDNLPARLPNCHAGGASIPCPQLMGHPLLPLLGAPVADKEHQPRRTAGS